MGWNTIIKPEKGLLAGQSFLSGDMTGNITFVNYTDNVDTIPNVSQDEQNHHIEEYVGWTPNDNSFDWLISNLDTTHKLVAGFRVSGSLLTQGGTFLCLKMWVRNVQNTENRKSAYIGGEWCKRVYTDKINYTETFPLGSYWPDTEYNFTTSEEFPNRSAQTIAIFLKTGYFNLEKNIVGGYAIGWRSGYASCYGSGKAFRAKYSWFHSASGFGIDAEIPDGEKESPEYGKPSIPKGGYNVDSSQKGTFDDSSDTITLSDAPTYNAGMSGYFHAYFMTETDLLNIGKAIFPEPFISSTDIIQSMNNLIITFWNSKKIDCILDCLILPIAVPFNTKEDIKCGGSYLMYYTGSHQSFVEGFPVKKYYVDFSCGKLSLDEYWANFLDFTGTRIKIFIPAVGYVDLQTEYLNGGEIELKYRFNIIDGSFMAYIISTSGHSKLKDSVIAQYSGVWAMHIPLTAQDNSNKVCGLISAVGAVTAGAMTGGASVGLGAVSSLGNTMIQKPTTIHANGYNASSSFLTHRKPYVIIERQSSQFSEIYPRENGLPCYVAMPLSQVHGFTIIENPVLNIDCNDEEYNEICNLLKSGVIF